MGRPKKILTESEQKILEDKIFVRNFIRRVLAHVEPKQIDWISNSSIVKSWVKKFPDKNFWNEFVLPDFLKNVDSLKPFTSNWGRSFIEKSWNGYQFMKKKEQVESIFEDQKIGADKQFEKSKPKSLKEFLW